MSVVSFHSFDDHLGNVFLVELETWAAKISQYQQTKDIVMS